MYSVDRHSTSKPGQPHGADDGDAERMVGVLEGRLHVDPLFADLEALLHPGAMRDDVDAPLLEIGDFVLSLADDDFDQRLRHPFRLRFKRRISLRIVRCRRARPSPFDGGSSFVCHRGMIRWYIRPHVILSMQTSMDLPDSHRVAQCSTKSAAILSSRSSAVMTS